MANKTYWDQVRKNARRALIAPEWWSFGMAINIKNFFSYGEVERKESSDVR